MSSGGFPSPYPSGADALFGQTLGPDPAVALPPVDIVVPVKTGPLHKVQYVIEFVGPRSIPAPAAVHLLGVEWYQALGQPHIYAMRPADLHWQRLTNETDGSYDSLSMAWDLVTPRGTLSASAAGHLLATAERFGPFINRRAVPLPHPGDVERVVRGLQEIKEALDIGFALNVYASGSGFSERDLWVLCARLGLTFGPNGSFDWSLPDYPHPLLSVTPFGQVDAFSLRQVQTGLRHDGVTVGFWLPLCPAPAQALDGCFRVATQIAKELGGEVRDEDDRRITARTLDKLKSDLRQALGLFSQAGLVAGAPETTKLFAE